MSSLSKNRWRKVWLAAHLYLGLSLGGLFALAGLTGSLLAFYLELDECLNSSLSLQEADRPRKSYEELFLALQNAEPERRKAWRLELPRNPRAALSARYYKPAETERLTFAPLIVSVNPYTAEILAKRFWGQFAMTWIYDLHYTLLFDKPGKIAMAIVGAALFISLATGIALWWPKPGKWLAAFGFKFGASHERTIYDLHKLNGIYGLLFLALLALTGIALELPQYIEPWLQTATMPVDLRSTPPAGERPARIGLDRAVEIAAGLFPQAQLRWIETPNGESGTIRVNLYQSGEPSLRFPKTNVWLDQYSGAVLHVHDPRSEPAGDTLLHWLHPLHSGEALGLCGRIAVCASGLACPALFVTGIVRRRQKKRAKSVLALRRTDRSANRRT